ncbi:hypothetical protein SAMN04488503_3300 [Humidesulfovibrio mexicanus]|uniref:Flagellar hook-associated protein 2 n=1 Tax=Humidesulfovibrio mexicanus TaxID=147047 RepID=A0A239CUI9_9BACT|nr:hypothetical protein [Humidesulfovibrio mexicanus]SNS23906.1 hypothetical protein SAMN04488503_3300 [Humidesulfovibrio mexicanus]
MTSIKWGGSPGIAGGADATGLPAGVSLYVDGSRARVGPTQSGLDDARQHLSSTTQKRLVGSLTASLSGALARLEERLDAVEWPVGGLGLGATPLGARTASVGGQAFGALAASVNEPGASSLEERLASRQRRESAASGLAAGTYGLTLSLGEQTDSLSVDIGAGWTAGQVHDAVAEAVNASSLAVEAEVRRNASGMFIGREALVLSADASQAGQAASLAATTGASSALTRWLDLSAGAAERLAGVSGDADGIAAIGVTKAAVLSTARATRYASQGFDPEAETTLAPGAYTLDYLVGPASGAAGESGEVSIQVASGDTWGEVLARMARVLGSASPSMAARLVPATRVYELPTGERGLAEASGLEVTETSGKSGWRLRLSGADAAAQGLLDALGLGDPAEYGGEAAMVVDGRTRTSPSGVFSADSGRLTLTASGVFGEAAPVRVQEGAQALADALAAVLDSYNEVQDLLSRNAGEVRAGVVDTWTSLAASRSTALDSIGVARTGQSLWLDEERFLVALLSRTDEVQDTLTGGGGFLTALESEARGARAGGEDAAAAAWIAPAARERAEEDASASALRVCEARTEAQVERSNQLLDLYDAAPTLDFSAFSGSGGILSRKG